jgi:hypothetical protein
MQRKKEEEEYLRSTSWNSESEINFVGDTPWISLSGGVREAELGEGSNWAKRQPQERIQLMALGAKGPLGMGAEEGGEEGDGPQSYNHRMSGDWIRMKEKRKNGVDLAVSKL